MVEIKKITEKNLLGDRIVVSSTEPTGDNRKKVWFQKGKNLFNKNDVRYGYELNGGDGSVVESEKYFVSDYIKVYPGQKLYKSGSSAGTSNCFYDENKNFISTVRLVDGVISVPTTNSISYMRTNGLLTDLDSIQITSGDTQLAYEAYIEPKIFIKNDNNIYEEFIKKQEEIYSTDKVKIGTWTNGAVLYRKVIFSSLPKVTTDGTYVTKTVSIGENINFGFVEKAFYSDSYGGRVPIPYVTNGDRTVKCYIDVVGKNIALSTNGTSTNDYPVAVVVDFTLP